MAAAATPATTYCNRTDIENLLSAYGVVGALDDNADGSEDTAGSASTAWITEAINHGATSVNRYLLSIYSAEEIALSPVACDLAVAKACCWLMARRGNPVPSSLAAACAEADEYMKEIRDGVAILPDAAPRASGLPSHTNVRVDRNFRYGKVRVIRPESDDTPADHAQRRDYGAEFWPYR